jgi:DNA helicase-2/ATP-dependent DNA helicase PcrA
MTIHLAKGLEFDSVFIAGVAEGFLPHGRSIDNENSLEEERRLMYVAMTRARKNLYLSFYGIPSRFINEIPEDCLVMAEGSGSAGARKSRWSDYDDINGDEEDFISLD